MNKKLYKSSRDKMLSGVCGGIGVYFNIDSTLVRLLWAFLTLCSCGTGMLAYIDSAINIPDY